MNKILILGGYGNFGKRIATALAKSGCHIVIAGRNHDKAKKLCDVISQSYPSALVDSAVIDIDHDLDRQLTLLTPQVVINTCGPYQLRDYSVATACIRYKIHYIDLSDGRMFVNGITELDAHAQQAGVLVVSGASTVPGLSSAVLEKYETQFSDIEQLRYGISPGQQANRGLATTQAIMTYVGKPLKPFAGHSHAYGWQNVYRQEYPELGKRWMANCEVPDLDILPKRYSIKSIQFSAGMELSTLHLGIWLLSWLVRLGMPIKLEKHAAFLLKTSNRFDIFGSPHGGMHMIMQGKDPSGNPKTIKWFIIAKDGDGPQIPTIPAIVIARKLVNGEISQTGATPCVGLVSLDEYLEALREFNVRQFSF